MKNMNKVLGVVLTLAILAGLLLSTVPVSAGNMKFSNVTAPVVYEGTSANVYAISPDGETIYMYINNDEDAEEGGLYKSTDGGYTWSTSGLDTAGKFDTDVDTDTDDDYEKVVITSLKINPETGTDMVATDGSTIYYSVNTGKTWKTITPTDLDDLTGPRVTSVDINEGSDDMVLLASYAEEGDFGGGVAYYDEDYDGWLTTWSTDTDYLLGANAADGDDDSVWSVPSALVNALAAAFSPDFTDDGFIVVVTEDSDSFNVHSLCINDDWDGDMDTIAIKTTTGSYTVDDTEIASIAMASDFDELLYVGLGNTDEDGVYYCDLSDDDAAAGMLGESVYSLAYSGTDSDGTLAVGLVSTDLDDYFPVYITTEANDADDAEFTESGVFKSPMGTSNFLVAFSPTEDILYAGSAGDASALSASTIYPYFDAVGLVRVDDFDDVTLSIKTGFGTACFGVSMSDGTYTMMWYTYDEGDTWKCVFRSADWTWNTLNSFDNDSEQAVWITKSDIKYMYKATDGGYEFSKVTASKYAVDVYGSQDDTYYFVQDANGFKYSGSSTYLDVDDLDIGTIICAGPMTLLVDSEMSTWFVSNDNEEFTMMGDEGDMTGAMGNWGFDVPNQIIYALSEDLGLVKWTVGTSEEWEEVSSPDNFIFDDDDDDTTDPELSNVAGWGQGADGNYYFRTPAWDVDDNDVIDSDELDIYQYWVATDINDSDSFSGLYKTSSLAAAIDGSGGFVDENANGNVVLKATMADSNDENDYPYSILSYTVILGGAPVAVAPAANAEIATKVTFDWDAVTGFSGTIKYNVEIAYDADFDNMVTSLYEENDEEYTEATQWIYDGLEAGNTYYWRVQVASPEEGQWSEPVMFTTKLSSNAEAATGINAECRIYPTNGATSVSTTPIITWGSVEGATSYEFKLATDASFTSIVESKTGLTATAFTPTTALKAGTNYFWQVRAISGTVGGDWVTSAFTTAAAVATVAPQTSVAPVAATQTISVPTPQVTVNVPTQAPTEANETPASVWVLIAIGGVLAIAVIVLIVRTRRV